MAVEQIIAMVVDTRIITLYRPDGSKIEIPQGTPGLKSIVDQVLPIVNVGGTATVDLNPNMTLNDSNPYKDFQELTQGAIQLFRVAKKLLTPMFEELARAAEAIAQPTSVTVSPMVAGKIPDTPTRTPQMKEAVDQIMANAIPATAENFDSSDSDESTTVIAKVGDTIVPGVEKLKGQFEYSAKLGSAVGLQKLIERMAAYVDKRAHSVEDLLKFLEKNDLPIADDGCIVAYKALFRRGKSFVDCHTKKVTQRVGSLVCVDESLVDKNRRNECSSGLHIGRRSYMGSFSGDAICIAKIAPEDVIVVPHGDPSKVRVCAYHLVAEVGKDSYQTIKNNKPMTDKMSAVEQLSKIIAGQHVGILEEVRINGAKGANVVVTPYVNGRKAKKEQKKIDKSTAATKHTALDDETKIPNSKKVAPVNVKDVSATTAVAAVGGRKAEARQMMDDITTATDPAAQKKLAQKLLDFKKLKKVSWDSLGISNFEVQEATIKASQELPEPVKPTELLTRTEQAFMLYNDKNWVALWELKKRAKVSWMSLGFNNTQIEQITAHKPE